MTGLPIRAATEVASAHNVPCDRCEILQNASTLVLRLSETLVARVVVDLDGPRQGTEWFAREGAVAQHLSSLGAPVIPLHPALPPGPYEHLGYTLNFWEFVTRIPGELSPEAAGEALYRCHAALRSFPDALPELAILTESVALLETLTRRNLFDSSIIGMLRDRLESSIEGLGKFPRHPVHGDAHLGNLMNTTRGVLWTDWEDAFNGPVEWDLASAIWNARVLEQDHKQANALLNAYCEAGGAIDEEAMHHAMIGRAAVMTAWYPILYPNLTSERRSRLEARLDWLRKAHS